ncbi:unnamed protein product [Protopolystoma xenopodis]|uniref:Uncharacterized protein n=1 Tax=Protopolystoma xenopodis TaxID=117903 RepID=A0A3S5CP92_9PLAT|nr:unnamed protein product [Protopolystoma xenopodis]
MTLSHHTFTTFTAIQSPSAFSTSSDIVNNAAVLAIGGSQSIQAVTGQTFGTEESRAAAFTIGTESSLLTGEGFK